MNAKDPYGQIAAMHSRFPQFRAKQTGIYDIQFEGVLHVRPNFPRYKVRIHYRGDARPIVKILSPDLVDKPPHWYRDINEPCLYKPSDYTWSRRKIIAVDIVPWLAGWIYFYEVWKRTGIWFGPEATHDETEDMNV